LNEEPNWRFLAYFDSAGKIVAGLTAVVALISAIVSLVFICFGPTRRRRPRDGTQP